MPSKTWDVVEIPSAQTYQWLLHKHYAKRIPNIMYSYGLFIDGVPEGIITYGMPASPNLVNGVCGEPYAQYVIELNRLCVNEGHDKNLPSFLVSHSLRLLPRPSIVVSYADTSMGHVGYIYQATNFLYTGLSAMRTDAKEMGNNQHARHVAKFDARQDNPDNFIRVDRPRKHRYVKLVGSKSEIRQMRAALNYPVLSYPKGVAMRYESGDRVASQMAFMLSGEAT